MKSTVVIAAAIAAAVRLLLGHGHLLFFSSNRREHREYRPDAHDFGSGAVGRPFSYPSHADGSTRTDRLEFEIDSGRNNWQFWNSPLFDPFLINLHHQ